MFKNMAKEKIKNNEPLLFAGLTIADPSVAELMAIAGVDVVLIDNEHMTFDDSKLVDCIRAVQMHGKAAVLRTSIKDPEIIGRYMQFGFDGLCSTVCHGVEEAKAVVGAVKYPTMGHKGLSSECRASDYGVRDGMGTEEYMKWANENSLVIITVESMDGVNEIEQIADLEGVDIVHIGPVDLSASMGLGGVTRTDEIREVLSKSNKILAARGNYNAYFAMGPDDIPGLLDKGAKCIFVPTDIGILRGTLVAYGKGLADAVAARK